ncbi:mob kinase activator-like [Anaeramoeba flamelloides]|uniref:Mob kinase activator-like n=1 Tax=Anaeramoeba flamelloides TaxID=1746091 RepID=A0AAV8AER9_9EUKA|nr:mob kinase activator-like [Anaeramoeba flamelloides]
MKKIFKRTKSVNGIKRKNTTVVQNCSGLKKVKETLGGNDLKKAVKLPKNENINNWVALHIVDFRNKIALFHGLLQNSCTSKSCPIMTAGNNLEYTWICNKKSQPQKLSAQSYINKLFQWTDEQINDESLFPNDPEKYLKKWQSKISYPIFRRLTRILGHIYHHHFQVIQKNGIEAHLNTLLLHFYLFTKEFSLLKKKDYLPILSIINELYAI